MMMTTVEHSATTRSEVAPATDMSATAVKMNKIVVLGATSGIALEVERQLARQGCELLLVARSPERLAALQTDLVVRGARQVLTCPAELASIPQHAAVFDFVRRAFPGFHTVFSLTAPCTTRRIPKASVETLLEELQVNYVSATAILTRLRPISNTGAPDAWPRSLCRRRSGTPLQLRIRFGQRRAFPFSARAAQPPSSRRSAASSLSSRGRARTPMTDRLA